MLNFAFVLADETAARNATNAMCEALKGVPAFSDDVCTILVPNPERIPDGRWVAYISLGTAEQNPVPQWFVVDEDRGLIGGREIKELGIMTITDELYEER